MPDPLHPAVVHFPIVLALLLPFVALVVLIVVARGASAHPVWLGLVAMSLLLAASAWAAVRTGEDQEEIVEAVVPEGVIHEHEEAAEGLLAGAVLLLIPVLVGLAPGRLGATGRVLTTAGSVVVAVLAVQVGGSGGELVYTHGAASAYTVEAGSAAAPALRVPDEDDDHR